MPCKQFVLVFFLMLSISLPRATYAGFKIKSAPAGHSTSAIQVVEHRHNLFNKCLSAIYNNNRPNDGVTARQAITESFASGAFAGAAYLAILFGLGETTTLISFPMLASALAIGGMVMGIYALLHRRSIPSHKRFKFNQRTISSVLFCGLILLINIVIFMAGIL